MTLEEAIYYMKSYLPDNQIESCIKCKYYGSCHSNEAHEMAISALQEQELSETQKGLDTISRQAALKICRKYWHPTFNPIMEEIEQLPSEQPEIIACADCKHWICHDRRCGFWNHGVKPLDWCCYAERREE